MANAALGFWIVTAFGGAYLWFRLSWRTRATETTRGETALPQLVLFVHPLLALAGLGVWFAYVRGGGHELTWVALGLLVATVLLGDVLFVRTLRDRPSARVEHQLPMPVVLLHGALGLTTLVLVLLTALEV